MFHAAQCETDRGHPESARAVAPAPAMRTGRTAGAAGPLVLEICCLMKNVIAAAAGLCLLLTGPLAAHAGALDNPLTAALKSGKTAATEADSTSPAAPTAFPYAKIITRYAAEYGVPVELARAVVRIESNFNPKARGSAGEIGLMQIKPATARMMGYRGGAKGLYDPETNIRFGMKYLATAHDLADAETCGTILRYNAGHGATRMNKVSARYCSKVKGLLQQI